MSAGGMGAADTGDRSEPLGPGSPLPPPIAAALGAPIPQLPQSEPRMPAPMRSGPTTAGNSAWYRTDQQRYRSVYRRANPWYRRLARGVAGLAILALVAGGLYVGAGELQDYLDRDRLPSPGQEAAGFNSTSFLITSSAPAPEVNGTLTIDTSSRAFEFVGGVDGPQSGVEIVSPDGSRLFVRSNGGGWTTASAGDPAVDSLSRVIPYLLAVDEADDVLENRLRKGYITLLDETDEGVDPDTRARYRMTLDTQEYGTDYPLQWQSYRETVVPGIAEHGAVPVTMWLDDENVVVRLRDDQTHWSWERLAYSEAPFAPIDPSAA